MMLYDLVWLGGDMAGWILVPGLRHGQTFWRLAVNDIRDDKEVMAAVSRIAGIDSILRGAGCVKACYQPAAHGLHIYDLYDGRYYIRIVDTKVDVVSVFAGIKKELSDLCPRCNVPGRFGARATLLCPQCNYVIGGLG